MVFIALRIRWLDSITDSMDLNLSILWETVEDRGTWHLQSKGSQRVWHNLATEQPEIALSIWQLLQGFMCGWVALGDEAHELLQSQIETNHYGCTIHVKPYFLWPLPFYFSQSLPLVCKVIRFTVIPEIKGWWYRLHIQFLLFSLKELK